MAQRLHVDHALRVFDKAVRSMRTHSPDPVDKGALSAAVTRDLPEASSWCQPRGATHVFHSLFLHSALPAGIRLVRGSEQGAAGSDAAVAVADAGRCRHADPPHVLGPATVSDLAAFLGTTGSVLRPLWPQDLAEVSVEGKRCWLPEEDVALLESPPTPSGVRLLPPGDAYLQARTVRSRCLIPATARRSRRPLGSSGTLVVNGEVHGFWRAAKSGRALRVTVTGFAGLDGATRSAAEAEA